MKHTRAGESMLEGLSAGSVNVQCPWSWWLTVLFKGPRTCDYFAEARAHTSDLSLTSPEAWVAESHTVPELSGRKCNVGVF